LHSGARIEIESLPGLDPGLFAGEGATGERKTARLLPRSPPSLSPDGGFAAKSRRAGNRQNSGATDAADNFVIFMVYRLRARGSAPAAGTPEFRSKESIYARKLAAERL
jgi:hypothetical protein